MIKICTERRVKMEVQLTIMSHVAERPKVLNLPPSIYCDSERGRFKCGVGILT